MSSQIRLLILNSHREKFQQKQPTSFNYIIDMRFTLVLFVVLFGLKNVTAQNLNRQFVKIELTEQGADIQVSDGKYVVALLSEQIIQTTFFPNGSAEKIDSSHAVLLQAQANPWELQEIQTEAVKEGKSKMYILKSGEVGVKIITKPFDISYFYKTTEVSEAQGYYFDRTSKIEFDLSTEEQLMGAGARVLGMNRRGYRLQLYNRAHYGYETHSELMNFTMPIVLSDKGYALHFDNPQIGWLDLDSKKQNKLTYEVIGGPLRYQVVFSDDWKDLTNSLTSLLGRQPLPARWTLGNFASRFGYHSETEAKQVVAEFRKQQIPLDAIIFDLYWFGKDIQGTLGNLEFYRDSFPNGEQMIADFRSQNVKTILITEPFILTTSKKWQEADRMKLLGTDTLGNSYRYDFYFGNTGLVDLYKPEARVWFWEIYKQFHAYGAAGFWGDLGEPEVHPTKLKHGEKWADEVHNIYGHDWARLLYEGYRKDYPTERPFILMRAGYSGSQQYGMVPWSGDVSRTWGGLKPQMEISLQMGLQGMAYMHSDLGGFAGANKDPELYVRWLQYGVFQPIFRPHAQQEEPSEAIYKDAQTKALAKAAIELRYQLLPYNYSIAYENHQAGTPLLRPIFMEFPEAKWSFAETESYMWGNAFLVHAITDSMSSTKEKVYQTKLPSNASWFELSTGRLVTKSKVIMTNDGNYNVVSTPKTIHHIPVFVRSGSFVPMSPIIQSTEQYRDSAAILHFYIDPIAGADSTSFIWYEDDGATYNAEAKGLAKKLYCTSSTQSKSCSLTFTPEIGANLWEKYFQFAFLVHTPVSPKEVLLNGQKVAFKFDKEKQTLQFKEISKLKVSSPQQLELKW
jgi:alpha-glucosidase (family GH31 glycosyl hydrolase)